MNKIKAQVLAERLAIQYAERYGIVEYQVVDHEMIYYTSYPVEHSTYKCIVDLTTDDETRTRMEKYYKPYSYIGKTQVNYPV